MRININDTEELLKDDGEIKHGDQLVLGFSSVDSSDVFIPVGLSPQQTCVFWS